MGLRASPAGAPGGLRAALGALGATLAETAEIRARLFAVELREEVERRKRIFAMAALAGVLLHMALVLVTMLVAAAFWDTHRLAAVGAMAALYLACGIGALATFRRQLAAAPAPFAATRGELERDLAQVRAR